MTQLPPQFDTLIKESKLPVLVDFYAEWCGPCKVLSPVIKQIAQEYKDRLLTIKIDTDKKQSLALTYDIKTVPTIMLFHKGRVLMRLSGAHPYGNLKNEIERALPLGE